MPPTDRPSASGTDHSTNPCRVTHDDLFKFTTSVPERAQDLMIRHLPDDAAAMVDTCRLPEIANTAFFDANMRGRICDRLVRLPLKEGNPPWCDVLIEHKSGADHRTALQVNDYALRLQETYLEQRNLRRPMPAITTMIWHFGALPWGGPRELPDFQQVPAALRRIACNFRTVFVDFTALSLKQMARDPATGALCRSMCLGTRRHADDAEVAEVLAALPFGSPLESRVLRYLASNLDDLTVDRIRAILSRVHHQEGSSTVANLVDEWFFKGRTEGMADTLLLLARRRFGEVPEDAEARIRAATPGQLETWINRVLDAENLAEFFGEPVRH